MAWHRGIFVNWFVPYAPQIVILSVELNQRSQQGLAINMDLGVLLEDHQNIWRTCCLTKE